VTLVSGRGFIFPDFVFLFESSRMLKNDDNHSSLWSPQTKPYKIYSKRKMLLWTRVKVPFSKEKTLTCKNFVLVVYPMVFSRVYQ